MSAIASHSGMFFLGIALGLWWTLIILQNSAPPIHPDWLGVAARNIRLIGYLCLGVGFCEFLVFLYFDESVGIGLYEVSEND